MSENRPGFRIDKGRTRIAADVRPEIELLLCCTRTSVGLLEAQRIKNLARGDIDWGYVLRLRHRITPLLYRNLNASCAEHVPAPVLAKLRDRFNATTERNRALSEELLKIVNLFESHGNVAVPYKGPVLATTIYPNLVLREFSDLDLLIRKRDFPKAKELLISQGYQPQVYMTTMEEGEVLKLGYNFQFVRDEDQIKVEIHWMLTPKYLPIPLDFESLWERLEPTQFMGTRILHFCPADLLLILCIHGSKDLWCRLQMICDVAELLRAHPELDWEKIVDRAETLGCRRILWLGLFLAYDLLQAPLPMEILERVYQDPLVISLAQEVFEVLFREADEPFRPFPFYIRLLQQFD